VTPGAARRILVVEDDPKTSSLVCQVLQKEGHRARAASSLFAAKSQVRSFAPDVLIVDRRLPDGDGFDFCRELRGDPKTRSIPLLFLTSKGSTTDKVVGLKLGADDYLTKPFHIEELLARVEALLRRGAGDAEPAPASQTLKLHGITLDLDKHLCRVGDKDVELWPMEFGLLKAFMERPGRLLNKEFLSEHVWGHELLTNSRAIDTSIQRLRRKLGRKGRLIETIKGFGFRFHDE
jgi:two-component system response regulator RegX3